MPFTDWQITKDTGSMVTNIIVIFHKESQSHTVHTLTTHKPIGLNCFVFSSDRIQHNGIFFFDDLRLHRNANSCRRAGTSNTSLDDRVRFRAPYLENSGCLLFEELKVLLLTALPINDFYQVLNQSVSYWRTLGVSQIVKYYFYDILLLLYIIIIFIII